MDENVLDILNNEREETSLPSAPPQLDKVDSFFAELEIEEDANPLIQEMQKFEEEPEEDLIGTEYPDEDHSPAPSTQSMGEDDFRGFGELVSDFVGTAKDVLDLIFDNAFQEKLNEEFSKEERKIVDLMVFLEDQGALSYDNRSLMEEWAEKYESSLPVVISYWVRYTRIRKRYKTTPYRENYKALIEKYTYKTLKKYWGEENRIGPEWVLFATLCTVLGFDVANLLWNRYSDRLKEKKRKKKASKDKAK